MTEYMADCKSCRVFKCRDENKDNLPRFCPMTDEDVFNNSQELLEENMEFFRKCSDIERRGYGKWPRLREIIELIKDMEYKKVGLAFCAGFQEEARILGEIFDSHGITLASAMCKTGAVDKDTLDIDKIRPDQYEPHCNPIGQALVLNRENTEFNIIMGLCVGHDSLFTKYADALTTTFVVKDRVTGHNPAVCLYLKDSYMGDKLGL